MNWIHLDLKGMMPGLPRMLRWIDWLAAARFDGIVFEYEDRLPWKTLPGLHRPVLTLAEWQTVWERCRRRGLQVAPLMQVQGHMEWVLKHPHYAPLREAGHWNELCPSHPDTAPMLQSLLDEVMDFHPEGSIVHLGADETWNLATCPACRARAEQSGRGRLGVFLEHVGALCRQVVARGRRPMIWADMFWRTETWSSDSLPPETILVDWQYGGSGPWETLDRLRPLDRPLWGASAIRSGFDPKYSIAPLGMRLQNVLGWGREHAAGNVSDLLHTVWGRGDSLRPLYGPWEGWLPGFLAAADPQAWPEHPLAELTAELDRAMTAPEWEDLAPLIQRFEVFEHPDPLVRDAVSWWTLSLRHRQLFHAAVDVAIGHPVYEAVAPVRGIDPEKAATRAAAREQALASVAAWRAAAAAWLDARAYSDREEYLATKLNGFLNALG